MTLPEFLDLLEILSERRPVFHSEADFQLALGWHIHETLSDSQVRPEFKPFHSKNIYLDLWLQNSKTAIELKYRTQKLKAQLGGEVFALRTQGAQDAGRYSFIEDISRLERLVHDQRYVSTGFAVLLTNDPSYWEVPKKGWENTNDADFRIHEERIIRGEMKWAKKAAEGGIKGMEKPIKLRGSYKASWGDYSVLEKGKFEKVRYLVVEVPGLKT